MINKLIIFVAEVKYPSVDVSYLTAQAYWHSNYEELKNARDDFTNNCEKDGFKILNLLVYNPHVSMLLSIVGWFVGFNRIQKPPKPVHYDAGQNP